MVDEPFFDSAEVPPPAGRNLLEHLSAAFVLLFPLFSYRFNPSDCLNPVQFVVTTAHPQP